MIFADSSVWIAFFNGETSTGVELLRQLRGREDHRMGDLIAMEILRGVRQPERYRVLRHEIVQAGTFPMAPTPILLKAAENYRYLRTLGITVRSTIDCIIASFCIEGGHSLIHADHDFDAFEQHLGLRVPR